MRIAVAKFVHETSSFSNVPTTKESFQLRTWHFGEDLRRIYKGVNEYVAGMFDVAEQQNVEAVPIFGANTCPSGPITHECYQEAKKNIVEGIREQGPFDGICLSLHGSGLSVDTVDVEGDILQAVREVVGYKIPIFVSLDLHANISPAMIQCATGMVTLKCYPHTDMYEVGAKTMRLLIQTLRHEIQPVMVVKRLPMMMSFANSSTQEYPAKNIKELCEQMETRPQVLECAFSHGFPYADSPFVATYSIVLVDKDEALAQNIAQELSEYVWSVKDTFFKELPQPEEGIAQAMQIEGGPVCINETSDNPGGGTPGDGTYLLKALLDANVPKSVFGFMCDPQVVQQAVQAGVGAVIDVDLGGKKDHFHGDTLHIKDVYVKAITDGRFTIVSTMMHGQHVNLGTCVRLTKGNVDIIVSTFAQQTFDNQVFLLHGVDIATYKLVCLKSSQHFKAYFSQHAKAIIPVDPPGLSTGRLERFTYHKLARPLYPFDKDVAL